MRTEFPLSAAPFPSFLDGLEWDGNCNAYYSYSSSPYPRKIGACDTNTRVIPE